MKPETTLYIKHNAPLIVDLYFDPTLTDEDFEHIQINEQARAESYDETADDEPVRSLTVKPVVLCALLIDVICDLRKREGNESYSIKSHSTRSGGGG